jgi:hypothetical protein
MELRGFAIRLLLPLLMLTSGFAMHSVTAVNPDGCCGSPWDPVVCVLNGDWVRCEPGFDGDIFCQMENEKFPVCCDTGGWCGDK